MGMLMMKIDKLVNGILQTEKLLFSLLSNLCSDQQCIKANASISFLHISRHLTLAT